MRATYSPSTRGMHHMSLRQGLRWFRRRTVSCDRLSWSVSLTISPANSSNVQRARPAGGLAQAVATRRASCSDGEKDVLGLWIEQSEGAKSPRIKKSGYDCGTSPAGV